MPTKKPDNDLVQLEVTKGIRAASAQIILGKEQICQIIRFDKQKIKGLILEFINGYDELELAGECLPVKKAIYNNHDCRIMRNYYNGQLKNIPNSCDKCDTYSCFKLQYCSEKRHVVIRYINEFIAKYNLTLFSF